MLLARRVQSAESMARYRCLGVFVQILRSNLIKAGKALPVWRLAMLLSAASVLSGCASASGIPGGPLPRGGGFSFNGAVAVPFAFGQVEVRSPRSEQIIKHSDPTADHTPIFPAMRAGIRIAPNSYFDMASDLGFNEGGVEARVGLPEGSEPMPLALAAGYRMGWEKFPDYRFGTAFGYGRAEAYPLLGNWNERTIHGVITAGLSYGNRYHGVGLPHEFNSNGDNYPAMPLIEVLRRETRFEATLGVIAHPLQSRKLPLGLQFMPYWVTNASPNFIQTHIQQAQVSEIIGYRQNFGFLVAFTIGYMSRFVGS